MEGFVPHAAIVPIFCDGGNEIPESMPGVGAIALGIRRTTEGQRTLCQGRTNLFHLPVSQHGKHRVAQRIKAEEKEHAV